MCGLASCPALSSSIESQRNHNNEVERGEYLILARFTVPQLSYPIKKKKEFLRKEKKKSIMVKNNNNIRCIFSGRQIALKSAIKVRLLQIFSIWIRRAVLQHSHCGMFPNRKWKGSHMSGVTRYRSPIDRSITHNARFCQEQRLRKYRKVCVEADTNVLKDLVKSSFMVPSVSSCGVSQLGVGLHEDEQMSARAIQSVCRLWESAGLCFNPNRCG